MSERSKSKRSQCKYVSYNEDLEMYILKWEFMKEP